ncbi:MAG TPA: Omp28-related outer membrane protein [Candidatus Coprenecus pullistercoris]|nr:Omp28-related outer membrane protein [Candidatus Coprenecus pullistercoris]
MNSFTRLFLYAASAVAAVGLAASCEPENGGQEPVAGETFLLSNEQGAASQLSLDMSSAWEVVGESDWFSVQPASGEAGQVTLTVTATGVNQETAEREGTFNIDAGGALTEYYVIQDGVPGIDAVSSRTISGSAQTVALTFSTNLSGIEASSDASWLTVEGGIEYGEAAFLGDGRTASKCREAVLTLKAEANGTSPRSAVVTLSASGVTATVEIVQNGAVEVDYSRAFYRRTLIMKFTGTWCQNCPRMTEGIDNALKREPDRFVAVSLYNESGDLTLGNEADFRSMFQVSSFPDGWANYYGKLPGQTNPLTYALFDVADEAVEDLPSRTAIGGSATVEGGNINLHLDIASKQAGEYRLNVFVLEDKVMADQAGTSSGRAEHNHIARACLYGATGEAVTLEANTLWQDDRTFELPANVLDTRNVHIAVYLTYEGEYTGSVSSVLYNYNGGCGRIVDNAALIPVDGNLVEIGYEE